MFSVSGKMTCGEMAVVPGVVVAEVAEAAMSFLMVEVI